MNGQRSVLIAVGDPERAPDIVDFLHRVDYAAALVDTGEIEASPPDGWPDRLALVALEHFLKAWRGANPDVEVRIENPGVLAG